jgi:hypothetical protein
MPPRDALCIAAANNGWCFASQPGASREAAESRAGQVDMQTLIIPHSKTAAGRRSFSSSWNWNGAERVVEVKLQLAERGVMVPSNKRKDKKVDKAGDMTFPASDPTTHGKPTGNEPSQRPADRKAPAITKEQIEQAQRGQGHKQGKT